MESVCPARSNLGGDTISEYKIIWEIELEADNPLEASKKALEIQRDPVSTALVFKVAKITEHRPKFHNIDLLQDRTCCFCGKKTTDHVSDDGIVWCDDCDSNEDFLSI